MRTLIWFAIFVSCIHFGIPQQCKQITVCDEDSSNSGGRKGAKGDVGAPGKAGPIGIKGSKGLKGDVGEKGMQGVSCTLGLFEAEIRKNFLASKHSTQELKEIMLNISNRLQAIENEMKPAQKQVTKPSKDPLDSSSTFPCKQLGDGEHTLSSGLVILCRNRWIVFQQNQINQKTFDKTWNQYKSFFGSYSGNVWLGLDTIHNLTKQRNCKLRVDLWDSNNKHTYAEYSTFYIDNESLKYTLHVSGFNGTAYNSLIDGGSRYEHNNMPFTTKDRDNDNYPGTNCARNRDNGGWWFNFCDRASLNRRYGKLQWNGIKKKSAMMLQCP